MCKMDLQMKISGICQTKEHNEDASQMLGGEVVSAAADNNYTCSENVF